MYRLWLVFVALALLLASIPPAAAERRVALVVGNDAYQNLPKDRQLHNAVHDARAMKATLESLGFNVVLKEDIGRGDLVDSLSDFAGRLGKDDIAIFYYAGHGVQLNGLNYILPSDISAPTSTGRDEEARLADHAVAETRVLDRIKLSGARVAMVVLDACRDNPLATTGGRAIGGSRGLSPPPETRGVISIYSAGSGQQALDRLSDADHDPNSVFTRVFLRKLTTPGLGLRAAAFETQGEVASLAASSGHDQVPGVYSQIIGEDVYLAGRASAPPAAPIGVAPQADFGTPQSQSSGRRGTAQEETPKLMAELRTAIKENDNETACSLAARLAPDGDREAQYDLGMCSLKVPGHQNFGNAFKWLMKSAEQNYPDAQTVLGAMYQNGDAEGGVNLPEAVHWYLKAVEQSNAKGQFLLASFYEKGWGGLPKDTQKAGDLYRRASLQNYPGAAEAMERLRRARLYR